MEKRRPLTEKLRDAQVRFMMWRAEQVAAHESGHYTPQLPFPENPFKPDPVSEYLPDGEGTEIELFVDPLTKVRQELAEIQKSPTVRPTYQVVELGRPPMMASPGNEKTQNNGTT